MWFLRVGQCGELVLFFQPSTEEGVRLVVLKYMIDYWIILVGLAQRMYAHDTAPGLHV